LIQNGRVRPESAFDQVPERAERVSRRDEPGEDGQCRERHRLDEQLHNDSATARTERVSHADLALAAGRSRKHEQADICEDRDGEHDQEHVRQRQPNS
jgi:hypothetical protein